PAPDPAMKVQATGFNAKAQRDKDAILSFQLSGFRFPPLLLCVFALRLSLALALGLLAPLAGAQESSLSATLPRNRYRNGEETLRAFAPISEATRYSIVKFNVDGATVALGTVVDTNGLALTKASELKKGKLTCWLAVEKEVGAEVIGIDEEEDVALVQVHARGLKP